MINEIIAKSIDSIIGKYFYCKNGDYYIKKTGAKIGSYYKVLDFINEYGLVTEDTELFMMVNDEVDFDSFREVRYITSYSFSELTRMYKEEKVKELFRDYIEDDEYIFLEDEDIRDKILSKLDFSKELEEVIDDVIKLIKEEKEKEME